ncbi:hypothetical protein JTB14_034469 [Gonioctena quinquepunctata]|nr:hypothetical protein JTB14_034469 [Gonioctena quinquepunctata]
MVNHPAKLIIIYYIANLDKKPSPPAFTSKNICIGFKTTGVEPSECQIFTGSDFASPHVSDKANAVDQPQKIEPVQEEETNFTTWFPRSTKNPKRLGSISKGHPSIPRSKLFLS